MNRILAIFVLLLLTSSACSKSYHLDAIDVVVAINSDGSFNVTESLTYDFSGSFTTAWRNIPLKNPQGNVIEISDIEVYGGAEALPNLSL